MIDIIFNVYKRPENLEKQINSILNQSLNIDYSNIHVWYNKSDIKQNIPKNDKIKTYICNYNTKYWGRFLLPLMSDSKYIAIFDDDIIPNKNWLLNCLNTINNDETNGILGGSGVILNDYNYTPNTKIGWNGLNLNTTERVDLVGHAWFFRQEWCKYLWYEKPYNWNNGEDIMFSFLSQKYGNINTYVPPHPINDLTLWSSDKYIGEMLGSDDNASFKMNNHYNDRNEICKYCIKNGWKTVNNIKKYERF